MSDPMKIRASLAGNKANVRILMAHEMETGQRKDGAGKVIPAWHITKITAALNGKQVMSGDFGPAVSKNPTLQFSVKGAKVGDTITIAWVDNKGDKRTDEVAVA
jgi:sulfur-oxidizing protein SoxZ